MHIHIIFTSSLPSYVSISLHLNATLKTHTHVGFGFLRISGSIQSTPRFGVTAATIVGCGTQEGRGLLVPSEDHVGEHKVDGRDDYATDHHRETDLEVFYKRKSIAVLLSNTGTHNVGGGTDQCTVTS